MEKCLEQNEMSFPSAPESLSQGRRKAGLLPRSVGEYVPLMSR